MQIRSISKPALARGKLLLIKLIFKVCNTILQCLQYLLFKKNTQPFRILVFRTGSLGDNLCAIPAIVAIRNKYPSASLDILANAGSVNLVTFNKLLDKKYYDHIIDYMGYGKKDLYNLLKKEKYDKVIYLSQTGITFLNLLRDMFFFRLITPAGFGWELSTVELFKQTQEEFVIFDNEVQRLGKLLVKNGIEVDQSAFLLNETVEDEKIVDTYLAGNGLSEKIKNIAIVVGAKRPQNRWPIAYFEEVIKHFVGNYNIILVGGPEDKELTAGFAGMSNVFNSCGAFTPIQSALLIKNCHITISNDTGPMHLSYAVGTPTIAIFSSRDFPGKWFPPENKMHKVFRATKVACSLCLSETCNNNICMQVILPKDIIAYAEYLLRTPGSLMPEELSYDN